MQGTAALLAQLRVAEGWSPANLLGVILFCLVVAAVLVAVFVTRGR